MLLNLFVCIFWVSIDFLQLILIDIMWRSRQSLFQVRVVRAAMTFLKRNFCSRNVWLFEVSVTHKPTHSRQFVSTWQNFLRNKYQVYPQQNCTQKWGGWAGTWIFGGSHFEGYLIHYLKSFGNWHTEYLISNGWWCDRKDHLNLTSVSLNQCKN